MEYEEELKNGTYCLPRLEITMICGSKTTTQVLENVNHKGHMDFLRRIFGNYSHHHLTGFCDKNGKKLTFTFWDQSEFFAAVNDLFDYVENCKF